MRDKKKERERFSEYAPSKKRIFWQILIVWCVVTLICVVRPEKSFSVREKRSLTTRESITLSSLSTGEFDEKVEQYVTDQIPRRNSLITLRSTYSLLTGNRYSQGVVLGKKNQMMEPFTAPSEELTERTVTAISRIGEMSGVPATFVAVPTAVGVCEDLHPAQLRTDDQLSFAASFGTKLPDFVTYCDLSDALCTLEKNGEQVYYRSDHHWRSESAFACLPEVAEALGLDPHNKELSKEYWTPAVVSEKFKGSLAAESGFSVRGEMLSIYLPKQEIAYTVTDPGKGEVRGSIYRLEELSGYDPYRVFLGGNAGELRIATDRIGCGRLLVFKDSYFNCFLPFLLSQYEEIDVIDPRFYSGNLEELLAMGHYDRILYFYNLNNLSEDQNLSLLTE